MYREALEEITEKIPDLKDQGKPVIVTEEMTEEVAKSLVLKVIPILEKSDYFTNQTKAVLKEFGWTREFGLNKEIFDKAKSLETAPVDEPKEDEPVMVLSDFIKEATKIRELKDICSSEPEFKSIRGQLASYKSMEILRIDMLKLLETPVIDSTATKLEKLDQLIAEKNLKVKPSDAVLPTMRETGLITTRPPFSTLFEVSKMTLNAVVESMQKNGYDEAFPAILWGDVMIDGHTRLKAAILAEIKEIPVEVKKFKDETEALRYAIHNQRDRRNLNDAELLRSIRIVDQPLTKEEAGAKGGKATERKIEPSHKVTAKVLGLGQSVVSDARTVMTDAEATKEVEEGKTTIRKAAKKVRAANKKPKEVIAEPKTPVEVVVRVLRDNAGEEMLIPSIVEQSAKMSETELIDMEEVVNNVLEVLIACRLVKMLSGDKIIIKKILK
jgi:hypothetical protein